jgi:hypothetical protein
MNLGPSNFHGQPICTGGPPKQPQVKIWTIFTSGCIGGPPAQWYYCRQSVIGRPLSISAGSVDTNRQHLKWETPAETVYVLVDGDCVGMSVLRHTHTQIHVPDPILYPPKITHFHATNNWIFLGNLGKN